MILDSARSFHILRTLSSNDNSMTAEVTSPSATPRAEQEAPKGLTTEQWMEFRRHCVTRDIGWLIAKMKDEGDPAHFLSCLVEGLDRSIAAANDDGIDCSDLLDPVAVQISAARSRLSLRIHERADFPPVYVAPQPMEDFPPTPTSKRKTEAVGGNYFRTM